MATRLPVRRWWYLMPIVFITYSLAYVDRANYSFAAAGGMAEDLHITSAMSSLLGSLFFLGYFFCQIPGTIYAEKRSARVLIFWCLLSWGVLATLTGIVPNAYGLIVIRFLLGVTEAAVMPAMLVYLSHWFTRAERSRANTFLILGNPVTVLWMSVLSGYIIDNTDWRWMFILEGAPALIWAVCWWFLVDDRPEQAKWLKQDEKQALADTFQEEQRDLKPVANYTTAFKTPQVILLCLQYFCWSIGVYGFVLWLPSILSKAGQIDIVETGWLSAAPYLAAVIGMLLVSWASDKQLNRRHFVWPPLLIAGLAFMGSYMLGAHHFWWSYALLIIAGFGLYAPYGPFFAIIPELLPSNVAGGAIALVNSCGALGGFLGAYGVGYLNGLTGTPAASYIAMGGSVLLSALLIQFVRPVTEQEPSRPTEAAAHS
ncbi:MFS transporter [Kushneria phosphatilytica]|uniref:MFS transporter n=1 Tax=Kushneria phosphatilytica TaxID=657387 RepID=A0A1S1NY59_9GAMM|nr:MFS transporter [Kushneria phosphatilytica]OHV12306.1 2-ketogluconate transporter [Kushneria phosphatilytica]QEL11512.1 MFS transporter [Kushneria phosphatilytica]